MDRRAFLSALTGGLLAAPLAAEAQPARKVYRIGVLEMVDAASNSANLARVSSGSGSISAMSTGHTTQSSTARLITEPSVSLTSPPSWFDSRWM